MSDRRFAIGMLLALALCGFEACRRVNGGRFGLGAGANGASGSDGSGQSGGCEAATCESLAAACGQQLDGCGGTLECGSCTDGNVCDAVTKACGPCIPRTCASEDKNCGTISDGCGGTLDCSAVAGGCQGNQTCGAEGVANVCGCKSRSCQDFGRQCGVSIDNCGRPLDCDRQIGGCGGGQDCDPVTFQCFVPNCTGFATCADVEAALGDKCGKYPNGCGGFVECGVCEDGKICDKETNECVLYPLRTPGDPTSPPAPSVPCVSGGCAQGFYCNHTAGLCSNPPTCSASAPDMCIPIACGERVCGSMADACNVEHGCGPNIPSGSASAFSCTGGNVCRANQCVSCSPRSVCPPRTCGNIGDGCGGPLNCNPATQCEADEDCDTITLHCHQKITRSCLEECDAQGKNCGEVSYWDGAAFQTCSCGTCTGHRESCGGGGFPGVCGVTPPDAECLRQQSECGFVTDSCGNQFLCGDCATDFKCKANVTGGRQCLACDQPGDRLTCADYPGQCSDHLSDGCGRTIDCRGNCGAAVCDTNPAGLTVDICCAPGQVIASTEDNNIPGKVDPANTVGDCCSPIVASTICPAGYCGGSPASTGWMQDSCGGLHSCGCDAGVACDHVAAFAGPSAPTYAPLFSGGSTGPIGGLCCQPTQVISVAQSVPYGTQAPQVVNDCCAPAAGATICQPGPVGPTSLAFCGQRADNCGTTISCPACPLGRVCDDKGSVLIGPTGGATWSDPNRKGACCATGELLGLPTDSNGATQGAGAGALVDNCCDPDENFCNTGGPLSDRCSQWQDNCGVAVSCGGCTSGACASGDEGGVPNGPTNGTSSEPYSTPPIIAAGFCCVTDPAFAAPGTVCNIGGQDRCGTWEDNCGGNYDCGGCANSAACDNNINDAGGLEQGGVCCAAGETLLSSGAGTRQATPAVGFGDCCNPADTNGERTTLCAGDRCGNWNDACGVAFSCDTDLNNGTVDTPLCTGSRACSTLTGVCCATGQQVSSGDGPPGNAVAVAANGACCNPMDNSAQIAYCNNGTPGVPNDDRCGTYEDNCGIDFTCATVLMAGGGPSGCLSGGACQASGLCCPAGQQISSADEGNKPNGAAAPVAGACCTPGSMGSICTAGRCGTWEDACGTDFACGGCGGPACDNDQNNDGTAELGGLCCAAGQTQLSNGAQGGRTVAPSGASVVTAHDCCTPTNLANYCSAPNPDLCGAFQDQCGNTLDCNCGGNACDYSGVSGQCCSVVRENTITGTCCTSIVGPNGSGAWIEYSGSAGAGLAGACCHSNPCGGGGGSQLTGCPDDPNSGADEAHQTCACGPGTVTGQADDPNLPGGNAGNQGVGCCAPVAPPSCTTTAYCGTREDSCNVDGYTCSCSAPQHKHCSNTGLSSTCVCDATYTTCGSNCCASGQFCIPGNTCCSVTKTHAEICNATCGVVNNADTCFQNVTCEDSFCTDAYGTCVGHDHCVCPSNDTLCARDCSRLCPQPSRQVINYCLPPGDPNHIVNCGPCSCNGG